MPYRHSSSSFASSESVINFLFSCISTFAVHYEVMVYRLYLCSGQQTIQTVFCVPVYSALLKRKLVLSGRPAPGNKQRTLRSLCPTCWTTQHQSVRSVLDNYYSHLQITLQQAADTKVSQTGTKVVITVLTTVTQTFQYFLSLKTGNDGFQVYRTAE